MATKLQHSINPLSSPIPINSNLCKPENQLDGTTWDCFQTNRLKQDKHQQQQHRRTVLIRFEDSSSSMDRNRMIEKQNQDYIKKTMQMQDSIFQHQVRELHRVYNVQKRLMYELRNEARQNKQCGPWTLPNNTDPKARFQNATTERSGSCSGAETTRLSTKGFDIEIPLREARNVETLAGPSSSSYYKAMNTKDCNGEDDNDLELTLSLGGAKNSCVAKRINPELGFESESNNSSNSSSTRLENHQHQRPHWLFQSLNLNKT